MSVDINQPLNDRTINNTERKFMDNLQANILKGHGREHVVLLFLAIKDVGMARGFLRSYPVSDSSTQLEETKAFKANGTPGGTIRLVYLTRTGLDLFGHGTKFAGFGLFSAGMAADSGVLDGGTTSSWQPELKKQIHVLLLVAHHDPAELGRNVGALLAQFDRDASPFDVVFVQEGGAQKNSDGEGIEHFGYVDGRSQPLMIQTAIDNEKSGSGAFVKYDPTAPLKQFILADPLQVTGFGSFFVFRKLEQNVAKFKQDEDVLGGELGLQGADGERAGAQVVGRFEDGTPVTLEPEARGIPVLNDFDYSADAQGSKCPFQGHIRKTNPRGSSPGGLEFDKAVQMARRGITYGARLQHPDTKAFLDQPNDGVGLLFMSYQASIEDQFHFMQTQWANSVGFPSGGVGIDPVIGQGSGVPPQAWCPIYGSDANKVPRLLSGYVSLKGGEYFYTPSIGGLRSL